MAATKDPTKVRAGTIGALRRWGEPGSRPSPVVRIGDLTPSQRELVLALISAARAQSSTEAA